MQLHTLGYKSLTRKTYFSFTVVQQVFVPNPPPSLLFRAICSTPSGAETYIKKTGFDASGESKQVRVSIWQAYCEQRFAAVLGIVLKTLFFKMDKPRPLFCLVLVFSNKHHYNFYKKKVKKMSLQNMVPGFEPMTFGTRGSSHNHQTRAPALF